jgi:drug/metabolite transporter (DMT)-like permease
MWGTSDFLGGVLTRRLPAIVVYGLSQAVGFVFLVIIATATGGWGADPGYWPWAIAASIVGMIAMICFYKALAIGPMGIVSPLVALAVLVPVVVSLLRGELPEPIQLVGIVVAILGILLASGPELTGAESAKPLILAGVAAIGFGGMFVLMAEGSKHDPLMTMTGMRVTTVVIYAFVFLVARNIGGARPRDAVPLVTIGILDAGANVMFGFATTMGLLSVTAVLGDLYPVVTAVLAAIFLRERLRGVQYAGVGAALFGVMLIAAGG